MSEAQLWELRAPAHESRLVDIIEVSNPPPYEVTIPWPVGFVTSRVSVLTTLSPPTYRTVFKRRANRGNALEYVTDYTPLPSTERARHLELRWLADAFSDAEVRR